MGTGSAFYIAVPGRYPGTSPGQAHGGERPLEGVAYARGAEARGRLAPFLINSLVFGLSLRSNLKF